METTLSLAAPDPMSGGTSAQLAGRVPMKRSKPAAAVLALGAATVLGPLVLQAAPMWASRAYASDPQAARPLLWALVDATPVVQLVLAAALLVLAARWHRRHPGWGAAALGLCVAGPFAGQWVGKYLTVVHVSGTAKAAILGVAAVSAVALWTTSPLRLRRPTGWAWAPLAVATVVWFACLPHSTGPTLLAVRPGLEIPAIVACSAALVGALIWRFGALQGAWMLVLCAVVARAVGFATDVFLVDMGAWSLSTAAFPLVVITAAQGRLPPMRLSAGTPQAAPGTA
jgi:hypothetical protein